MTQLMITLGLIFLVYFIGYFVGRATVISEIRDMTEEFKRIDEQESKRD